MSDRGGQWDGRGVATERDRGAAQMLFAVARRHRPTTARHHGSVMNHGARRRTALDDAVRPRSTAVRRCPSWNRGTPAVTESTPVS